MSSFDEAISDIDDIIMDTFGNVTLRAGDSEPVRGILDAEPILVKLENGGQVISYDAKVSVQKADSGVFARRKKITITPDRGSVEYFRVDQILDGKDGEVVITLSVDSETDENASQSTVDIRY